MEVISIHTSPPLILVFAGNDPSGGAGLCADIQSLASLGCQALPVITCITVQDTRNVIESIPLSGTQVIAQAEAVLADLPVTFCKIGLLGSVEIIEAVQHILLKHPSLPVILDPILAAGGGHALANEDIRHALINCLLPLTTVLTPNSQEARLLSGQTDLDTAAYWLLDKGCHYVCITGTHEETPTVVNTLYGQGKLIQSWSWSRFPSSFHGSGCTFASSLTGFLAQGKDIVSAVYAAQEYTWTSLRDGFCPGQGQAIPNRING